MSLDLLIFARQFDRFKEAVHARWGAEFISFREGGPHEWEGYKERVRDEALETLEPSRWKRRQVGSGEILRRVIAAIEINRGRHCRNNLVAWEKKHGPNTRTAHLPLIKAQSNATQRQELEQWFLDFYQGRPEEGEAFTRFTELAGKNYGLVAYLFFLKNWNRFMPIATRTFDDAFQRLGIDFKTGHQCSWENYRRYNDTLREVQNALAEIAEVVDPRLIDAHSFLYMLAKLEVPGGGSPVIPLPRPAGSVSPVIRRAAADEGETEAGEMSERDYERRDRQRRALGKRAELIALQSERRRLREAGRPDLAERVDPSPSRRPSLGFDLKSFEVDGRPRYIEVKAARRSGRQASFILTENERVKSRRLANYHVYLVFGCRLTRPEVVILRADQLHPDGLTPLNYDAKMILG